MASRDQKSAAVAGASAGAGAGASVPLTSSGRAIGSVKAKRSIQLQMPGDSIRMRPRQSDLATPEMALVGCSNMTTDVWNGEALLLDVQSGAVLHRISAYGGVSAVDFAGPDHSMLLTAGDDGAVNVWGLDDALMALKQKELKEQAAAGANANANANAKSKADAKPTAKPTAAAAAAAADADKSKAKGNPQAATAPAGAAAMTDDGDDDDEDGGLSDLSAVSHITSLYDHSDVVSAVAVCPSAPRDVLTASWDHTVKLWDLNAPQYPVSTFDRHSHEVWAVRWSSDANFFVSSSRDKTVRFWDRRAASASTSVLGGAAATSAVSALAFDAVSAHQLVTASECGLIAVYDTRATQKELLSYRVGEHYVRCVEACPDASGRFAVTTDSPLLPVVVLQLQPAASASAQPAIAPVLSYRCHSDYPRGVCWTADGGLLTASWDKTVAHVAPQFAA